MRKILTVLLIVFIAIQFIRPAKNTHAVIESKKVTSLFETPRNVNNLLEVSCKDCHSNNTAYPWYNKIQPVMWFLTRHVNEGKKHLNFDEYGDYNVSRQYHKMEEIVEVLNEDEMPYILYFYA
ncbi:MAG TPA: heme-binding domain-containing protein [Chitinophagales bacterium]|nr:heme-binding domain-containing protein [Chitinophagales bacterium]